MKVLLDNTPEGVLTEEQRQILIDAATKWEAHYLIYATEYDGKHYFLYGIFKDLAPRYRGIPFFVYMEGNNVIPAHYSIDIKLWGLLDSSFFSISSKD